MTIRVIRMGRLDGDELVIEDVDLDVDEFARRIATAQIEAARPVAEEIARRLAEAMAPAMAAFGRLAASFAEVQRAASADRTAVPTLNVPARRGSVFHAPIVRQQRRPKTLR